MLAGSLIYRSGTWMSNFRDRSCIEGFNEKYLRKAIHVQTKAHKTARDLLRYCPSVTLCRLLHKKGLGKVAEDRTDAGMGVLRMEDERWVGISSDQKTDGSEPALDVGAEDQHLQC